MAEDRAVHSRAIASAKPFHPDQWRMGQRRTGRNRSDRSIPYVHSRAAGVIRSAAGSRFLLLRQFGSRFPEELTGNPCRVHKEIDLAKDETDHGSAAGWFSRQQLLRAGRRSPTCCAFAMHPVSSSLGMEAEWALRLDRSSFRADRAAA